MHIRDNISPPVADHDRLEVDRLVSRLDRFRIVVQNCTREQLVVILARQICLVPRKRPFSPEGTFQRNSLRPDALPCP